LKRAIAIDPNHLNYRYLGELELAAARAQMAQGRDPSAAFAAADAATRRVLAADGTNADVQRAYAAVQRWQADWLVHNGRPADVILREGLAAAARAEKLTPDVAESFATEGALHLIAARAARVASERVRAADQARAALEKALTINRFLSREYRPLLDEAGRMGTP
jgi:serine/threonine-protein kinase